MEKCSNCGRLIAGQLIATNKKFLGRNTTRYFCLNCLAEQLQTTREKIFEYVHNFIELEKCELFETEVEHTKETLTKARLLSLDEKIRISSERITEWYLHYDGKVYISFSGGKDSTVLLHLARLLFPDIEGVFVNTGLEYPEIQRFVNTFENVTILRPKMRFDEVIKKYGYPIISKEVARTIYYARKNSKWAMDKLRGKKTTHNQVKYAPILSSDFEVSDSCCSVMKKSTIKEYENLTRKKKILATMTCESQLRMTAWLKTGCNAFGGGNPASYPMSFWDDQDVYRYIKKYEIPIATVYGDIVYETDPDQLRLEDLGCEGCGTEPLTTTGATRTGCIFCGFGCHLEKSPNRFQRLKETHPKQYEYCIGGGEYDEKGVWKPSKKGLGLGHVFDELNKIYGEGFIKY